MEWFGVNGFLRSEMQQGGVVGERRNNGGSHGEHRTDGTALEGPAVAADRPRRPAR
jgi:hypothetical protein